MFDVETFGADLDLAPGRSHYGRGGLAFAAGKGTSTRWVPLAMAPSHPLDRPDLTWTRRRDSTHLILSGATFRTASRVAAVVGTLLTLVNQAGVIAGGEATCATAIRVAFNYLIPYVVASIGYFAPFRTLERHGR